MKFHFWNFFFLVFFVVVAAAGYLWLEAAGRLGGRFPLTDLFLIALASQRLVRLFAYDHVTDFFRNWFVHPDPRSLRSTMGALLGCPWCTGLWFALVLTIFYFATPIAWYAILVLAISSVATFFQLIASLVGWSAELKKKKAQQ